MLQGILSVLTAARWPREEMQSRRAYPLLPNCLGTMPIKVADNYGTFLGVFLPLGLILAQASSGSYSIELRACGVRRATTLAAACDRGGV